VCACVCVCVCVCVCACMCVRVCGVVWSIYTSFYAFHQVLTLGWAMPSASNSSGCFTGSSITWYYTKRI